MTTVAAFLQDRGFAVSEAEIVSVLQESLGEHLTPPESAVLSPDAEAVMVRVAGQRPASRLAVQAAGGVVAAMASMVAASWSVEEVAQLLSVDASRVRHRIADSALYSLRVGRRRVLPRWQFEDGRPLPGLAAVLAALPRDLHPLEVAGFMSTPQPELHVGDDTLPPRRWLASGGDPSPVVDLAASLAIAA